ncbi:sialidase family protein [Brachyspira pilosicoli]|uniref:sialidase family protein n=1 Tax=Brachyspira pilosicoli TaxID=52584 RepID=UPI003007502A
MSKKIIYLLSLLMALSLVFASCKKNAAGTGDLTPPTVDNETGKEDANQNTGLFEDFSKIPAESPIKEYEVFQNTGKDTYRNPVVVSMGSGVVFAFGELRYETPGAANDVGINGENAVDIVYKVSQNSGYDWDSQLRYVVGRGGSKENAHGAPNVFKVSDTQIVVVATSGGGIGRTAKAYGDEGKVASKVDYAIGTVNGANITWGEWKEVQLTGTTIQDTILKVKASSARNEMFNQYATAPGRGVVVNNNTILLSLVVANQGKTTPDADIRELMGRYVLKGQIAGDQITWTQIKEPISYTTENVALGPWKETQLYGGDETTPKFFIVPSPWTPNPQFKLGKAQGQDTTPQSTSIQASEGTAGIVELNQKWFGTKEYDPKNYATLSSGGENYNIFTHVQETANKLALYVVDPNFGVKGNPWLISVPEVTGTAAKSSSVDVLPDGTIIVGFEHGRPAEVPEGFDANKVYRTFFARYSQSYIAAKTGNNK